MREREKVPRWLKLAYLVFLGVWVPAYCIYPGPVNFLWLCDIANFLIGAALWLESPLLISSQAVSVLLIQAVWLVDFGTRLVFGFHPVGGTEYMFDPVEPLPIRILSLFHVVMPFLVLWTVHRLGYDRRGPRLQTAIAWVVLPVSFVLGTATTNLNWLWAPFGVPQTLVPPAAYLLFAMAAYPLVLYLPTHLVLARLLPPAPRD